MMGEVLGEAEKFNIFPDNIPLQTISVELNDHVETCLFAYYTIIE